MEEIRFFKVESLPPNLSKNEDGIYFVKSRTSIVFKYYVVSNGRAYEIDAVTVDRLNQALSVKFDKPNGTNLQYIKGDGTYGLMNKEAVGLRNVDNTSDLNKPISTATQLALDKKADDNKVVHIDGYEIITGNKEFSKPIVNPIFPTDDSHLTNKAYVDSKIESVETGYVLESRRINTENGLEGGGELNRDLYIGIDSITRTNIDKGVEGYEFSTKMGNPESLIPDWSNDIMTKTIF